MKDLGYVQPLRLQALLGARPRLKEAARPWVEGDFVPACWDCGTFAALTATATRREAARLVGATGLEGRLTEISKRFGEVWLGDSSKKLLWSLELLYTPS